MENVIGRSRARPTVALRPGVAPTAIPPMTPARQRRSMVGAKTWPSACPMSTSMDQSLRSP